jgi:hypothetical protein
LEKWGNIPMLIGALIISFVGGFILFQKRVARYF